MAISRWFGESRMLLISEAEGAGWRPGGRKLGFVIKWSWSLAEGWKWWPCALKIRQQGFVLMYHSAYRTWKPPILSHQPFLDLDLGAGAEGLQQAMQGCWPHTQTAFLVSLLTPPALPRCEFLCCCWPCRAKMPSQEVSLQGWMFGLQLSPPHNLQGTCMPSSGKISLLPRNGRR